jgi:hypothetical protein
MNFADYTDAILSALKQNPKVDDVVARKHEILEGVYRTENLTPTSVLFVGFNPAILSCQARTIAVTEISLVARNYLDNNNVKYTYIDRKDLPNYRKQFECVVAMDEYFTFADSDLAQQALIAQICSLATAFVISTLRDYKNQDFKEREFSIPALVRNGTRSVVYLESHDWDLRDRNRWNTKIFEIDKSSGNSLMYGAFERHTMFFKQLAKFSMDAGAVNFLVHKNLMYKSLIKKNYEHVVSIQFDQ